MKRNVFLLMIAAMVAAPVNAKAAVKPVICPVTAMTQERHGIPSKATILASDGNVFEVLNPWEDSFPGELWLMSRDDRGTDAPEDDILEPLEYIGYEAPGPAGLYTWYLWNGSEYVTSYSAY